MGLWDRRQARWPSDRPADHQVDARRAGRHRGVQADVLRMAQATFTRAGRADAARAVERALASLERRTAKIEDGEVRALRDRRPRAREPARACAAVAGVRVARRVRRQRDLTPTRSVLDSGNFGAMNRWNWLLACALIALAVPASLRAQSPPAPPATPTAAAPDAAALKKLVARLMPVDLTANVDALPANERAALALILRASQDMDPLFRRQVWAGNETLLTQLVQDTTPLGRERWHAFVQNQGPWLRLDDERPFLLGIGDKPAAANFYPADATKADLEKWMKGLPAAERASAGGFFTTIRRAP